MKDFHKDSTTQAPRAGFTVIDGGKSEPPGHIPAGHPMNAAHQASQGPKADPELPPGFKRADHAPMLPGGIPVTDENGVAGELMPVSMGAMPPELALMLLMAMMSAGRGPKN